jgi:hypothetical protein
MSDQARMEYRNLQPLAIHLINPIFFQQLYHTGGSTNKITNTFLGFAFITTKYQVFFFLKNLFWWYQCKNNLLSDFSRSSSSVTVVRAMRPKYTCVWTLALPDGAAAFHCSSWEPPLTLSKEDCLETESQIWVLRHGLNSYIRVKNC